MDTGNPSICMTIQASEGKAARQLRGAKADQRIDAVLRHLVATDRVLDVGCAHHSASRSADPFWLHQHIAGKCAGTTGFELEGAEAENLRALGYNVIQGNVEDSDLMKQVGSGYDAVVAGELIEHLENPGRFFDNMARLIKPGGKLILTTPNAWNFFNIASTILRGRIPIHNQHVCWYDEVTMRQLIGRHPFDVVDFEYLAWMENQKWRSISRVLRRVGLVKLGGAALFFVLQRKSHLEEN
jgi:SAM-dependent methyltransferase